MPPYTAAQARRAHLATPVAMGALSAMTVDSVVSHYAPSLSAPFWWPLVLSVFMGAGVAIAIAHEPSQCRRCWSRFPADDGDAAAERHRHVLWRFHQWGTVAMRLIRVLAVPFRWLPGRFGIKADSSLPFVSALALGVLVMGSVPLVLAALIPGPWVAIVLNWFYMWLLLVVWCRHRQLRQWCRWCRDDGGGDDGDGKFVPDPDPAPGKTITG